MMLVFTICSNNYLAQAKTLMDSVLFYSKDCIIIIGLVDQLNNEIDYTFFEPAQIIQASSIGIENFDEMCLKYNIIELNTSVKPSFFKYLIKTYPEAESIIYFDPDICVYQNVAHFNILFKNKSILLTPHILSPIPLDGLKPQETVFLSHGVFNLGFIAIKPRGLDVNTLLDWWEERCLKLCFIKLEDGLFVDQYWINLFISFSQNIEILYEPGYNMAPWNLHERYLTNIENGELIVNSTYHLYFYHFSSYKHSIPKQLCPFYYNRFSFADRSDLVGLYDDYLQKIISNKVASFEKIKCTLIKPVVMPIEEKKEKLSIFKAIIKEICPPLLYKTMAKIKRINKEK